MPLSKSQSSRTNRDTPYSIEGSSDAIGLRKRIMSSILSCLSLSIDYSSTRGRHDEVRKPLYFIKADPMEAATVQTADDESKARSETEHRHTESDSRIQQNCTDADDGTEAKEAIECPYIPARNEGVKAPRFFLKWFQNSEKTRFANCLPKLRKSCFVLSESPSIQKDVENEERSASRSCSEVSNAGACPPTLKRPKFRWHRRMSRALKTLSKVTKRKRTKRKCVRGLNDNDVSDSGTNDESGASVDAGFWENPSLGVAFAHPAYSKRCSTPNPENRVDFWTKFGSNFSLEVEEYTLPPTKTNVETAAAESWISIASSTLYPTDESSIEGPIFCSDSFDSEFGLEMPFDEVDRHDLGSYCRFSIGRAPLNLEKVM